MAGARIRHDLDLFVAVRPHGLVDAERLIVGRYTAWDDGRWLLVLPGPDGRSMPMRGDAATPARDVVLLLLRLAGIGATEPVT